MSLFEETVVDSTEDKRVLQNMFCSDVYLEKVIPLYYPEAFESEDYRAISRWVQSYFNKFGKAPKEDSRMWIAEQLKSYSPEKRVDLCDCLSQIMGMEVNESEASIALGIQFFQKAKVRDHLDNVKNLTDRNQFDKAMEAVNLFELPKIDSEFVVTQNALYSEDLATKFFDPEHKVPILKFPYALGTLLNRHMIREGFVAFQGCAKSTKSTLLRYIIMEALRQGLKVYHADLGDSTGLDLFGYMAVSLCGRSRNPADCGPTNLDFFTCERGGKDCPYKKSASYEKDGKMIVGCAEQCRDMQMRIKSVSLPSVEPLTQTFYEERLKKLETSGWLSPERYRCTNWPAGEGTLKLLNKELENLKKKEGFVPDIIVVDYADLLGYTAERQEERNKHNENWKGLRKLSQTRNCLVITATQAKISAYGKAHMSEEDFSEDSRKFHHVTAFFAINRNKDDIEAHRVRICGLRVREGHLDMDNECVVSNCLQRGQYHVHSVIQKKEIVDGKKKSS